MSSLVSAGCPCNVGAVTGGAWYCWRFSARACRDRLRAFLDDTEPPNATTTGGHVIAGACRLRGVYGPGRVHGKEVRFELGKDLRVVRLTLADPPEARAPPQRAGAATLRPTLPGLTGGPGTSAVCLKRGGRARMTPMALIPSGHAIEPAGVRVPPNFGRGGRSQSPERQSATPTSPAAGSPDHRAPAPHLGETVPSRNRPVTGTSR